MTRRHFQMVAETLRIQLRLADSDDARQAILDVAAMLCDDFKIANPRFDRARFLAAVQA